MNAKRKAVGAAVSPNNDNDEPDAKRRKLPLETESETPEATTANALDLLNLLKEARDKRNRLIAADFITLPDKKLLPEYYHVVALPVALDTIEDKLQRHAYPNMSSVESDLKRMIDNAKAFNERSSDVHNNAEKIRKMVSHHMQRLNPAYQDPDYVPFPTPLPGEVGEQGISGTGSDGTVDGEVSQEAPVERPRRSVILHGPKEPPTNRGSSTPALQGATDAGESFEGNTFQQAQEKIVTELMELTNDEGDSISLPFINLPSRELKDYYQVIKSPVSLKGVQKHVRGIRGREKPTGVSFHKSWQSFEDEVSLIWNNARLYNEDGSDISNLAGQLERYFRRRFSEAKAAVAEPAQPRVKLRAPEPPSKITLHVGPRPGRDVGDGSAVDGVAVDTEALKRQQDLVKAGANGLTATMNTTVAIRPQLGDTVATTSTDQIHRAASAGSPSLPVNGVKDENQSSRSPAPTGAQPTTATDGVNGVTPNGNSAVVLMPPPAITTLRPPSGSPHPQATHSTPAQPQHNPFDSRFRTAGKDASDALIANLDVYTHPNLPVEETSRIRISIPASQTLTQQSVTMNLPASQYCLRVAPSFAASLSHRSSKVFVTVNNQQIPSVQSKADTADPQRPIYDARLTIGALNRVDVEAVAVSARGVTKVGPGSDLEFEKITLHVNVFNT